MKRYRLTIDTNLKRKKYYGFSKTNNFDSFWNKLIKDYNVIYDEEDDNFIHYIDQKNWFFFTANHMADERVWLRVFYNSWNNYIGKVSTIKEFKNLKDAKR